MRKIAPAIIVLGFATGLGAQEPQPSPSPLKPEFLQPSPPAIDTAPRTGVATRQAPSSGEAANAGLLRGVVALSLRDGEARLRLSDGSERVVRPGDQIGTDVVKRVTPERIVLARGAGVVTVTFDGQGRGRVRVYSDDPGVRR